MTPYDPRRQNVTHPQPSGNQSRSKRELSMGWNETALSLSRAVGDRIALDASYPAAQCLRNLQLVDLPYAMERNGFRVGAALMKRWFTHPAFAMPPAWKDPSQGQLDHRTVSAHYLDTTTVPMSWALSFGRTQEKLEELKRAIQGQLLAKSLVASQDRLFGRLQRAGKLGTHPMVFGSGLPAVDLHETAHLNSRVVSSNGFEKLTDPIDDLYCALGAFTLHAAAEGIVTPLHQQRGPFTHQIDIHSLGFYIRDCYDFTEDQPLGNWSTDEVGMAPMPRLAMVENASFRRWRAVHQRGGDFLIFSNVHWEKLNAPITWFLKVP
ncbi:DUF6402 family protein [Acidovorax sp. SUPP950]|uniref:DUF6402 family protein n=1 Tax=Acidovorax sp. SUPP950 TaxID=511901 RepID=UPI0023C012F2|nr:DUF6402 family protein [Acidovorax sp. SUPP950]GKS74713.1 DUF6402 family protein [Acidovorax sp. SUPP950]